MPQSPDSQQFCSFRVGNLTLGVSVVMVQEVFRYQEMTVVPLAPDAVRGLINLRGQIVMALDMRKSLGLAPRPAQQTPMNVVIHLEEGLVSLLVDDIGDVIEASALKFSPPPDNLPSTHKEWISGVYRLPRELLLILDAERLLSHACGSQMPQLST